MNSQSLARESHTLPLVYQFLSMTMLMDFLFFSDCLELHSPLLNPWKSLGEVYVVLVQQLSDKFIEHSSFPKKDIHFFLRSRTLREVENHE